MCCCSDVSGVFACYAYIMAAAVVVALGTPLWRGLRMKCLNSLLSAKLRYRVGDRDSVQGQGTQGSEELCDDDPNIYRSVVLTDSQRSDDYAPPASPNPRTRSQRGQQLELVGIRGPITSQE
jgi:hypothetical protein